MDMDFRFIQDLVDCLCGAEVHLAPNTRAGMMEAVRRVFHSILPEDLPGDALIRDLTELEADCIYELSGPVDLQFAFFLDSKSGQVLIVGPCRTNALNRAQMVQQLQPVHMKPDKLRSFVDYCLQQPVVSYDTLHRLAVLIARQLTGQEGPVPFQRLDYHWNEERRRQILMVAEAQTPDEIRIIEGRYEASAALTEAVKQGNLSMALRFIQKMGGIPEDLVRNPNPLRNAQNLCIVLNTQLRHALEEEGVWAYQLDELSSDIGRRIEGLKTLEAANAFFAEILQQYCILSQERELRQLSPFGRLAVTYIHSHLTDNLTVKEAARALLVNPDYLSTRFHQEVGIPFISYVNQERIKQAAALLRRTSMQVQQVAAAVGYNNTSYFARQFLKFQGVTPTAYRKSQS